MNYTKYLIVLLVPAFLILRVSAQNPGIQILNEQNNLLETFVITNDTSGFIDSYSSLLKKYPLRALSDIEFDAKLGFSLSLEINDFEAARDFLIFEIQTGLSIYELEYMSDEMEYKEFLDDPIGKLILTDHSKYYDIYKSNLNLGYYTIVAGITTTDQFSRSILDTLPLYNFGFFTALKSFNHFDDSLRFELNRVLIRTTDSLNFILLKEAIVQFGYPTNTKIGRGGLGFLLSHYYGRDYTVPTNDAQNSTEYFDSLMYRAVLSGEFSPNQYAFLKDYPKYPFDISTTKSTYGTAIPSSEGTYRITNSIYEIEELDNRRSLIGLPPLWVDAAIKGFKLPTGYNSVK
tara:strand:- start:625 stop:1662 length:1038 start_codon:yes stop_codon:yes gene_type:complete